jgi:SMI1/KNR4 family protein SUKH-1
MDRRWIPLTETGPHVTEDDIRQFERELGHELPPNYRHFLLEVNGGYAPSSNCVFLVRRDPTVLNSLYSLKAADETDDLATRQRYPKYPHNDLPKDALAIGYDEGGGRIVLPLAGPHRGEIWYLETEDPRPSGSQQRVEWFERRNVSKLADSFADFMAGLRPLKDADTSA